MSAGNQLQTDGEASEHASSCVTSKDYYKQRLINYFKNYFGGDDTFSKESLNKILMSVDSGLLSIAVIRHGDAADWKDMAMNELKLKPKSNCLKFIECIENLKEEQSQWQSQSQSQSQSRLRSISQMNNNDREQFSLNSSIHSASSQSQSRSQSRLQSHSIASGMYSNRNDDNSVNTIDDIVQNIYTH